MSKYNVLIHEFSMLLERELEKGKLTKEENKKLRQKLRETII